MSTTTDRPHPLRDRRIMLRVNSATYERLKHHAYTNGFTVNDLANRLIEAHLADLPAPAKARASR